MGISITQPAPKVDQSYIPRITGLTRLWGGLNVIANQLAEMGVSASSIANMLYNTRPVFVFDDLSAQYASGHPCVIYNSETGTVINWNTNPPASMPAHQSDLAGRYHNASTPITSPKTYTANNSLFYLTDEVFGDTVQIPLTQDDINAINQVTALASSSHFAIGMVNISPSAKYVLVEFVWTNGSNKYSWFTAMFEAITETEPWT